MSTSAAISPTDSGPSEAAPDFSPFLKSETHAPASARRVDLVLLLLACAALLVRPSDLFPQLEYWPAYQTIILFSLAVSVRSVIAQVVTDVRARAITLLVIAFGASIVFSHLARGNLYDARVSGFEFFKVILFYLVVLATIDSVRRLRIFVLALCAFTLVLTLVAVASYDGLLDVPALEAIRQADVANDGGVVRRLVGTGVFNDPNDLSLLLVVAIGCSVCVASTTSSRWLQLGLWLPIGFFVYAITLTYSRGGLIALISGSAVAMCLRYGVWRTILPAAALLLPLLLVFGGRQTHVDLSNPEDTFQTRLDRWSDALTLFKSSPFAGVGQNQQVEIFGHVTHNSYLQSFAELGFGGGAIFLGLVALAILGVKRIDCRRADATLIAFRPYVAGVVAGYATGLLSLSRGYTISTYLVIALAAAFINVAPTAQPLVLSAPFFQKLAAASVLMIIATYLFVRVMSGGG
jgi:putative inorganic carbon (hco3(-)) transporter